MSGQRSLRVIELNDGDQAALEALTRRTTAAVGVVRRARIVLLAAEGVPLRHIGPRVGVSRPVVRDLLYPFRVRRLAGLHDQPRPGRPRRFSP